MKKVLLLILTIILLVGCQKNKEYELIIDPKSCLNCVRLVYLFEDGTRVYSQYADIRYKTDSIEIPMSEALEKKYIKLSDLEDNENFKIYKQKEDRPLGCIN